MLFITVQGAAIENCINNIRLALFEQNIKTDILIVSDSNGAELIEENSKFGHQFRIMRDNSSAVSHKSFKRKEEQSTLSKYYERLMNAHKYNLVITCSGIFKIHSIKRYGQEKRYAYLVDPYSYNQNIETPLEERIREELDCMSKMDGIFCTPQMYMEYKKDSRFSTWLYKIFPVELPLIVFPNDELYPPVLNHTKINLVYAGQFYNTIRSPEYMLHLLLDLPSNVCLNIVGNVGRRIKLRVAVCPKLRHRISFIGYCSKSRLHSIYQEADALINIGNSVSNQVPSKLFEYMSEGKPIVNFSKNKECLSAKYLDKYPLYLQLNEFESLRDSRNKFVLFLHEILSNKEQIPFRKIEEDYTELTPKYVSGTILNVISKEENLSAATIN